MAEKEGDEEVEEELDGDVYGDAFCCPEFSANKRRYD